MTSIQSQLTRWLVCAMIVLTIISGGALALSLRSLMIREFDRSLQVRGRALEALVSQRPSGRVGLDANLNVLTEYSGPTATEYYAIEDLTGKQIASSQSSVHLALTPDGVWNTLLPGNIPARATRYRFSPTQDKFNAQDLRIYLHRPTPVQVWLTVARDRRPLNLVLLHMELSIIAATTVFSLGAVVASVWIVRRGLDSLRGLGVAASGIDFTRAGVRFEAAAMPRELLPIVDRLNELVARGFSTIARERQFTAAVSHEFRTPIAELRSAADIALREPENLELARRAAVQTQEIAIQMQAIVSSLLSIASSENAAEHMVVSAQSPTAEIDRAAARYADVFSVRNINFSNQIGPEVMVLANASLMAAVFDNVISNAARYAESHTRVMATASCVDEQVTIAIANKQNTLLPADVTRVFEPFWRKDSARSEGQHVGLGLSLVRAYCGAMEAPVDARLTDTGEFVIDIRFKLASSSEGPGILSQPLGQL